VIRVHARVGASMYQENERSNLALSFDFFEHQSPLLRVTARESDL
jgi:hypothetical protein